MARFWRRKSPTEAARRSVSAFTTDVFRQLGKKPQQLPTEWPQPQLAGTAGVTLDSSIDGTVPSFKGGHRYGIPEAQASWYLSQGFIGYSMCTSIAKQWLVDKAITMPARDALRQGYRLDCDHDAAITKLDEANKDRGVNAAMQEFITTGRRFGGAAALFVVESTDPDYYENPFNIDGVGPGSYKGIRVIEPPWMSPDLTAANIQDPASIDFYDPTFWVIGNKRYHKSHFRFYVPYPVADMAKHTYRYFGVSVPERIYERVYGAERTANEGPQLAMTKRLLTMGIPDFANADKKTVAENIAYFVEMRDNYGVNVSDENTVFNQFDTALGDLDTTIMTQFQLVAAAANVPATKLLETTPKGFNSSGEYEEASYREGLESIQTNDLDPFMTRHLDMLTRDMELGDHDLKVVWNPLDSPTAKEYSEINLNKSTAAKNYADIGAIDGADARRQLVQDRDSDFYGIGDSDGGEDLDIMRYLDDETDEEAGTVGTGTPETEVSGATPELLGSSGPRVRP